MRRARRLVGAVAALLMVMALVMVGGRPVAAAFPGGDGKIVFVRANQVYTINPSGSGLVKLTTAGKNYQPAWSPDGKRIAYINETTGGSKDIWVMQANGSAKTRVTRLGEVFGPSFSADGRWIAFGGPDHALMRIRSVAPFAGLETLLGTTVDYGGPPPPDVVLEVMPTQEPVTWSTGREIWWHSISYPDSPDHYVVRYNIDSKFYDDFAYVGGACCGFGEFRNVAVSADNTKVGWTYVNDDPDGDGLPHVVIYQIGPSWGMALPFTSPAHDDMLTFSPSGAKVAVVNDATGVARIFVANANGSGRRLLTTGYSPDWQPTH